MTISEILKEIKRQVSIASLIPSKHIKDHEGFIRDMLEDMDCEGEIDEDDDTVIILLKLQQKIYEEYEAKL